jgi:hypothetical protein
MKKITKLKIKLYLIAVAIVIGWGAGELLADSSVNKNIINKKISLIEVRVLASNDKDQLQLIDTVLTGALDNWDSVRDLKELNERTNSYITINKLAYMELLDSYNRKLAMAQAQSKVIDSDNSFKLNVLYDFDSILLISLIFNAIFLIILIARREQMIVITLLIVLRTTKLVFMYLAKVVELIALAIINLIIGFWFAFKMMKKRESL